MVKYKFEYESKCYEECPIGTYNNSNFCEKCHLDCRTCDRKYEINNTNCKSCSSSDKYLYLGNCVTNCSNGFYYDEKDPFIKLCKCELNKCFNCSRESLRNNLCLSCNKNFHQKYNDSNNRYSFIDCYQSPKGYYLNSDLFYELCYLSCEECNKSGNDIFHNCVKCKSDYNLEIIFGDYKNCYNNCTNYHYFDKSQNKTFCTEVEICPEKYSKLIPNKRECVSNCSEDKDYKYEFRKQCYSSCPLNSTERNINNDIDIFSLDRRFFCEPICGEEEPFEMINTQECVKNCDYKDLMDKTCILNFKGDKKTENEEEEDGKDKVYGIILEGVETSITSGNYNTSDLENGKNDI